MKKFITVLTTLMVMGAACLFAEDAEKAQAAAAGAGSAIKYIAAAIAVGIACISGGAAVGKNW